MKTISTNRSLNENFKRVQLLPVLDPETMARLQAGGAWSVVKSTVPRDRRSPRAAHSIERTLPVVLGLTTLVGLGQVLAVMTNWPTNWIALAAWVSRFAG
jgi:hypothetical protein